MRPVLIRFCADAGETDGQKMQTPVELFPKRGILSRKSSSNLNQGSFLNAGFLVLRVLISCLF